MFAAAVVVSIIVGSITLPVCLGAVVIHWEVWLEVKIAVRIVVGKSEWYLRGEQASYILDMSEGCRNCIRFSGFTRINRMIRYRTLPGSQYAWGCEPRFGVFAV